MQGFKIVGKYDTNDKTREECESKDIVLVTGKVLVPTTTFHEIKFYYCDDSSNRNQLKKIFEEYNVMTVVHNANYFNKDKFECYRQNVYSLINILWCMKRYSCNELILSSTTDVYSSPPLPSSSDNVTISPTSFYALSKYTMERMAFDQIEKCIILREGPDLSEKVISEHYHRAILYFKNRVDKKINLIINIFSNTYSNTISAKL